jgi:hypothetical protein
MRNFLSAVLIALVALPSALAQSKPAGSGHWEGTLQIPDREMKIAFDLAQNAKGDWIGTLAVPEQNIRDLPLAKIVVKGTTVAFELPGIPGDPSFQGDISPDGKSIKGDLAQGGGMFPLQVKWVSEAEVKPPAKSTPITKEFEGVWEGVLTPPDGRNLRLRLTLANGSDGATGTLASLDQGGRDAPFTTITQKASQITLELKAAGITYTGELKGEEIAGTFTQGPGSLPLTLKRAAKE